MKWGKMNVPGEEGRKEETGLIHFRWQLERTLHYEMAMVHRVFCGMWSIYSILFYATLRYTTLCKRRRRIERKY